MTAWSVSSARFTAAQPDLVIEPRVYDRARPPVVFMTGGAGTALTGPSSATAIVEALAATGLRVFMPSVPWLLGNSTSATRVANALTYAQANGATTGPPVLVGVSNGAVCALAYARTNPVACVITVLAPVDINYARDNDVLSTRTNIDAAWGVTYPDPLPAHADLWTDRADWSGKPIQMWGASDDPFDAGPNKASAFATAAGAEFHDLGALGHTDAAVLAVTPATVVAFVQASL